jgi:hypothetical protein
MRQLRSAMWRVLEIHESAVTPDAAEILVDLAALVETAVALEDVALQKAYITCAVAVCEAASAVSLEHATSMRALETLIRFAEGDEQQRTCTRLITALDTSIAVLGAADEPDQHAFAVLLGRLSWQLRNSGAHQRRIEVRRRLLALCETLYAGARTASRSRRTTASPRHRKHSRMSLQ